VDRVRLSPLVWIALGLWILNDHVLKAAFPGVVTGKLSDVAGLIAFPMLPIVALELARKRKTPWFAVACVIATALVMIAIKTTDEGAWLYIHGLGALQWPFRALGAIALGNVVPPMRGVALVMDPTDLYTLPALIVPLFMGCARADGSARSPRAMDRLLHLVRARV
jgi:hypothetical protein